MLGEIELGLLVAGAPSEVRDVQPYASSPHERHRGRNTAASISDASALRRIDAISSPPGPLTGTSKSLSHTGRYPSEISAIPATTAITPTSRSVPIPSRPVIARNAVAITTLDSRTADTDAAGASLSAASASA